MARNYGKKTYHKNYRLRRVRSSSQSGDLSALAANVAITAAMFGAPAGRPYRMISCNGTWSLEAMDINDGPLVVGFAHGDYTATEIKECIEAAGSINVGNKIEQERANRLVRIVATFGQPGVDQSDVMLNDGKPIKTRLNWLIPLGITFNIFVYNDGSAAVEAITKQVKFNGDCWVKDL